MIIYRLLRNDERPKLAPIFAEHNRSVPDGGIIAGALDDDEIVGFLALQVFLHGEPIWIKRSHRGRVNFLRLVELLKSQLAPGMVYYAFTPNRNIERLAEAAGMKPTNWGVWEGVI